METQIFFCRFRKFDNFDVFLGCIYYVPWTKLGHVNVKSEHSVQLKLFILNHISFLQYLVKLSSYCSYLPTPFKTLQTFQNLSSHWIYQPEHITLE